MVSDTVRGMLDTSTIPGKGPSVRSFATSVIVPTDPQTAWSDWASADALTKWWQAPEVNIDLRIGGPFEILFSTDGPEGERGSEGCRYVSYVPGEMISFTWNAPPHLALRSSNTWVVITFTESQHGTEVRLVHTGFLEGDDWDAYMDYFRSAWEYVLGLQRDHRSAS